MNKLSLQKKTPKTVSRSQAFYESHLCELEASCHALPAEAETVSICTSLSKQRLPDTCWRCSSPGSSMESHQSFFVCPQNEQLIPEAEEQRKSFLGNQVRIGGGDNATNEINIWSHSHLGKAGSYITEELLKPQHAVDC